MRPSSSDGILNCAGTSNGTARVFSYVNTFSVVLNAAYNVYQLICTREDGARHIRLVNGVAKSERFIYGVNTTGVGNNVDTYMTATQVNAAADWNNVISVHIALAFNNPLYVAAPLQTQPAVHQSPRATLP